MKQMDNVEFVKEFLTCCDIVDDKKDNELIEYMNILFTPEQVAELYGDFMSYSSEKSGTHYQLPSEKKMELFLIEKMLFMNRFIKKVREKYKEDDFAFEGLKNVIG